MSDDLRSKLIRLAHENPNLRGHLLPLLKEANSSFPSGASEKNYQNAIDSLKTQISDTERKIRDLSDIASPLGSKAIDVWLRKDKQYLADRKKLLKEIEQEAKDFKAWKAKSKTALTSATVETFLMVLSGRLTRADEAARKRDKGRGRWNVYQLGHQLGAVDNVKKDMAPYLKRDDEEAMQALKRSICRRFTCQPNGQPHLTGARQTVKMIDQWLEQGKFPKY